MPAIDASYHDDRISMEYWFERLDALDVPTPETAFVPLEHDPESNPPIDWNTDALIDAIEGFDTDRAFIRTDRKSAQMMDEGSFIPSANPEAVDGTVMRLLLSAVMGDIPAASLAVREWLDLERVATCYGEPITPEVRVFIDEGEVLCSHLRTSEEDFDRSVDDPEGLMADLEERHQEVKPMLHDYAQTVADEFDETGWSVDFVPATDGTWYATDMALYGLYYFDMDDDEGGHWKGISHHDPDCPHNLQENPPEDLPESPKNAREGRIADI